MCRSRFWTIQCFWWWMSTNLVYAQWVVEDDGCRTPDRGTGNCIPVDNCQSMLDVLKAIKRPISSSVLAKLQAYTCGANGASVKVCCPSGPIILEPSKKPQVDEGPPDVSNHKNLRLLPSDCGYLNSDNRIINGEDAALNEFPWMALLRYNTKKGLRFNCGGTVINKNYILTAAHCLNGQLLNLHSSNFFSIVHWANRSHRVYVGELPKTATGLVLTYRTASRSIIRLTRDHRVNYGGTIHNCHSTSVRVGEHSIKNQTDCEYTNRTTRCNPPVQDVRIEQVIPHPRFGTKSFINDIGLVRVSTMNFNVDNVKPICLPLGRERTKTYDAVFVTGWGVTNTETGETSDILQKVRLPIADKSTCVKTYQDHNIKLTKAQICAGGVHNKDSCPGDSGGPMMVPTINEEASAIYIQHGVVSFGPKYCGIPGYPGVYTLVNYYMDWILDNIR